MANMININNAKSIGNRTRFTVYGWVRNQEKTLTSGHVPSIILASIILYYRNDEIFVIIGNDAKLSKNRKIVTKTVNGWSFYNNHFGMNQIDSTTDIVYTWKLLIRKDIMGSTGFGICSHLTATKEMSKDSFDEHYYPETFYLFRAGEKKECTKMYYEDYIKPWNTCDEFCFLFSHSSSFCTIPITPNHPLPSFCNIVNSHDCIPDA